MGEIAERPNVWTLSRMDSWDGAEIVAATTRDGVSISVCQEHAMDSYNKEFTCVMELSREEAEQLALFLIRATEKPANG